MMTTRSLELVAWRWLVMQLRPRKQLTHFAACSRGLQSKGCMRRREPGSISLLTARLMERQQAAAGTGSAHPGIDMASGYLHSEHLSECFQLLPNSDASVASSQ